MKRFLISYELKNGGHLSAYYGGMQSSMLFHWERYGT